MPPAYLRWQNVVRDVQEARRQLVAREYDKLEKALGERQKDFEKSPVHEERAWSLLQAPSVDDAATEALLSEWVRARPRSWAALAARGLYYHSTGWRKRGTLQVSDTPQESIEGMLDLHRKATTDCLAALEIRPTITSCHAALIAMAGAQGDTAMATMRLTRGEKAEPRSFIVPLVYLRFVLSPRWGGSFDAMAAFAAERVKRTHLNPRFLALPGYILAAQGQEVDSRRDSAAAVKLYTEAIQTSGEEPAFYADLGVAYSALGDRGKALEQFDRAIQLGPYGWWGGGVNLVGTLERRAMALWRTGRRSESLRDCEAIKVLDPTNLRAVSTCLLLMKSAHQESSN